MQFNWLRAKDANYIRSINSGARSDLPVYKILSQKAIFDAEKRQKEQAKLTRKEVQITTVICDHDFDTKLNHAKELLRKGNGIQLSLIPKRDRLLNTQVDYPAIQQSLFERFEWYPWLWQAGKMERTGYGERSEEVADCCGPHHCERNS